MSKRKSEEVDKVDMSFIAQKAGVSRSTVARVIYDPKKVKEETRSCVQAVMAEHKYVYNLHAADFTRQKTSMFALIIPTVRSSIHAEFIEGIHDGLRGAPYDLAIGYTGYDVDEEAEYIKVFAERKMAGIIILGLKEQTKDLIYSIVARKEMGVVSAWEYTPEYPISCVGFDNYGAARKMTRYLISLGHRRIGLITGPTSASKRVMRRLEGYKDALEDAGIPFDSRYVIHTYPSLVEGRGAATRMIETDPQPTAIFAASDALAIGVLKALRDLGVRVPEQVSVCGFDNTDIASYCTPTVSTVAVPAHEMGLKAAQCLLRHAEDPDCDVRKYCLDTELIIRDSSAPLWDSDLAASQDARSVAGQAPTDPDWEEGQPCV